MGNGQEPVALGALRFLPQADRLIDQTGADVFLRAQSLMVLAYLVEHRGKLVSRDDLLTHIWADVAVTDDSLTQCIGDIRKALGTEGRQLLKTIPKRGYMLITEPVEVRATPAPAKGFGELAIPYRQNTRVVLACQIDGAHAEALIRQLPANLKPTGQRTGRIGRIGLFDYDVPAKAMHAARHMSERMNATCVICRATQSDEDLAALLRAFGSGEIVATVDVIEAVGALDGGEYVDLGEVTVGAEALRLTRVVDPVDVELLRPELDLRDILPTVAVLPFLGAEDQDSKMFGLCLADQIAQNLSLSDDLNVISSLSTRAAGGAVLAPDGLALAQKLNADFVLSGFVLRHGTGMSISLEFSQTENQLVLWSTRLQIETAIATPDEERVAEIGAQLRRAILRHEVQRIGTRPLKDLKLFSVLHGAVGLMYRMSQSDFMLARSFLDYVAAHAPQHPAPLAWTARWHVFRVVQGWTSDPRADAAAALELTARALDLDPEHAHSLVCEGQALVHLAHQLEDAEDRYDAALQYNPNDANAYALRGMLRSFTDRGAEGMRDTERGLHLTPLHPHRYFFLALAAGAAISAENYERARLLAKESLRLNRTHMSTWRMLAVAEDGSGNSEAARATTTEMMRLQPDFTVTAWERNAPSAEFANGRRFAEMLRGLGVPQ